VALKRQNLAIVDDRDIEALSLSAHIDADPYSHASQHGPPPVTPALWLGELDGAGAQVLLSRLRSRGILGPT
jgi:hypothetical protein